MMLVALRPSMCGCQALCSVLCAVMAGRQLQALHQPRVDIIHLPKQVNHVLLISPSLRAAVPADKSKKWR